MKTPPQQTHKAKLVGAHNHVVHKTSPSNNKTKTKQKNTKTTVAPSGGGWRQGVWESWAGHLQANDITEFVDDQKQKVACTQPSSIHVWPTDAALCGGSPTPQPQSNNQAFPAAE
eukprot:TRINITY_DN67743_c10_g12_i1.p2 TRINITY_DN67743_c10_g12~~TRINITY_DN67743_c10_g12_i1.p2  ORF type:complete len:115 (-),score=18.36 TRINITY_DN67743_c10_g12_i1:285-629(-)